MDQDFDYILNKIMKAEFITHPFFHLEIKNFLSKEHLDMILQDKQIHFEETTSDDKLYSKLIDNSYSIQPFPGCMNNWNDYINRKKNASNEPTEGSGITFRLKKYDNYKIEQLINFLNSDKIHETFKLKFKITEDTRITTAIQKYLDGYEISPHPDISQKALTYLLNINRNDYVQNYDIHTHLATFKPEYKWIEDFWENNVKYNRCWVPWDWCNTEKKCRTNNTLLVFKPSPKPSTLHAVKLDYNHHKFQRTQIYGNLMYEKSPWTKSMTYKDLNKSIL